MPVCKKIVTTSIRASAAGPYVDVALGGVLPHSFYMLRPEWPRQRDRVAKVMDSEKPLGLCPEEVRIPSLSWLYARGFPLYLVCSNTC